MSAFLCPVLNDPQCDANGAPLVGGKIFTYLAGSSTPAATYTSSAGTTPQANPIILNARGVVDSPIWLTGGQAYKLILTDANSVPVNPGFDNVQGINDPSTITAPDQWATFSGTPTFASSTTFQLAGDQTGTFQVGRRIKAQCTAGVVYATVTASVFTTTTAVTISPDVLSLDSGLSVVSYAILSAVNDSVPRNAQRLLAVRAITSSGTYTPTTGTSAVVIKLGGGGGGGGGCVATGAGQIAAGAGGSAGGYAEHRMTTGFSGQTITIGSGGSGGGGGPGANGGTTSFGAVFNATGGVGGGAGTALTAGSATSFVVGGAGGTGAGGNILNTKGEPGGNSLYGSVSAVSGQGGSSLLGGGGASVTGTSAGISASSFGAGGGGSSNGASAGANTGGSGANGVCIVWEYA